jgi:uncharacterized protein YxjI
MASSSHIYRIHHKSLTNNHKFEIDNGTDEILYTVRSTPLSLSDKLSLCEASTGKELIKICEENHLHLRYDISAVTTDDDKDGHLATVKRIHGPHHSPCTFEINSIYGVYKVEYTDGLLGLEFKVTTGNKTVVDVTKSAKCPKLADMFQVDISGDDGGDLFLLAIVITLWCAQRWRHI